MRSELHLMVQGIRHRMVTNGYQKEHNKCRFRNWTTLYRRKIQRTTTDFNKFQNENEVISRLIVLKNKGRTLNDAEKSKETKEVRGFLRNFVKLFVSKDDGLLDRPTSGRAVLPKKLVPLVFTELHVNIGDLSKDRTLNMKPFLLA